MRMPYHPDARIAQPSSTRAERTDAEDEDRATVRCAGGGPAVVGARVFLE